MVGQQTEMDFNPRSAGPAYDPELDQKRLTGQINDIFQLMKDGKYRTLREIEDETNHPSASISAQLRHLRKPEFGSHTVDKRRRAGLEENGVWEYQLLINE
jgi:hypothetical protein